MNKNTFKTILILVIGFNMLSNSMTAQNKSESDKEYVPDDLEL